MIECGVQGARKATIAVELATLCVHAKTNQDVWSVLHDASLASFVDATGDPYCGIRCDSAVSNDFDRMYRCSLEYDMSAIPAGAKIIGASLCYWPTNIVHTIIGGTAAHVVEGTSDYATSGYNDYGTTSFGALTDLSIIPEDEWHEFVLNASGIAVLQAALDAQDSAYLGLRENHDLSNTAPTWGASDESLLNSNVGNPTDVPMRAPFLLLELVLPGPGEVDVVTLPVDHQCEMYYYDSGGSLWATAHDASAVSQVDQTTSGFMQMRLEAYTASGQWVWLARNFFTIHLGKIQGTIVGATLKLGASAPINNDFSGSIVLVEGTPADPYAYGGADYDQVGTTVWSGPIALSTISTAAYNSFPLNAAGIAALNAALTGDPDDLIVLGMRWESDKDDSPPSWVSGNYDSVFWEDMEDATYPPIIEITVRR